MNPQMINIVDNTTTDSNWNISCDEDFFIASEMLLPLNLKRYEL